MIIVKLLGGLGNQMFQYALGKTLALDLSTELKLETFSFENDFYKRVYKLECFNLKADIIKKGEFEKLLIGPNRFFPKILSRMLPVKQYTQIAEKDFNFNKSIWKVPRNAYLIGFWQSERYFFKYREILKNDFSFKEELEGQNNELARQIEITNSVCIHFRRQHGFSKTGETDMNGINLHGLSSMEYYHRAISLIIEKIKQPHFFVFSDQPEFAKENLKLNCPITFVTNNDDEHCQNDMRLMSLCKHNIIANSSFSWWGAWLNQYPDKIVIAPKQWFATDIVNYEDIVPESWMKL